MLTHKSRFLLAALHIESLSREDNVRDIRESLRKLPEDLDTICDEALQRIQRQDRQKVARADQVLTLINCAYRPLQVREIQNALAVRPGDTFTDLEALPRVESLLSACCGLAAVEGESQVVRLVHYTTEEYFTRKNQYRSPAAHLTVAGTLITYLNFTTFAVFPPAELVQLREAESRAQNDGEGSDRHNDSGESRAGESEIDNMDDDLEEEVVGKDCCQYLFETNALLQYAVQHWGDHAREAFTDFPDFPGESYAEPPSPQPVSTNAQRRSVNSIWNLKELILNFLEHRANVRCACDALSYLTSSSGWSIHVIDIHPHTPSLQIVSAFGIHYMVKQYLKQGAKIDEKDPRGTTALHRAAEYDHVRIMQLLLDSGCVVELQDAAGHDALSYSVRAGSLAAVRMLLNGRSSNEAAFRSLWKMSYASDSQRMNDILELLAEHMPDQAARNKSMGGALEWAAFARLEAVVHLILLRKCWTIDKNHLSHALSRAVSEGWLNVTRMLLKDGADVHSCAQNSPPALHRVAMQGNLAMIRLLLEAGADVNQDYNGDKPLHFALRSLGSSCVNVIDLLLDRGADVDALNRQNESAIIIAAMSAFRYESAAAVVERLLEHGADPAGRDHHFGRTSLEWSIIQGEEPLVKLLLPHADISVSQSSSMLLLTRIYCAVNELNAEASDQLLCREDIRCLESIPELLLLHTPAEQGFERVVRLFLDMGAATDSENDQGKTALHLASMAGHLAIVQLLVAHKADVNARKWYGYTPLLLAAFEGRTTVAEFLLDHGAEVGEHRNEAEVGGFREGVLYSPLAAAVCRGHTAIANLLIERGADVNIRLHDTYARGGTLLHLICCFSRSSHASIWSLLIDKGIDLESKDSSGDTALVVAVKHTLVDFVRYLLKRGADPRALPHDVTSTNEKSDWDGTFARGVGLVMEAQRKLLGESTTS
jgi:uncharacterized protein